MALFTIKEGAHYHAPFPISMLPWIGERKMSRTVTFDANCQYDSADYNAQDVNKLFGLSFGFGGVHHNSARFGWRWSKADQCIELLAYCYVEGKRNQDEQLRFPVVAQVKPGQKVNCQVSVLSSGYFQFEVWDSNGKAIQQTGLIHTTHGLPIYGLTHGLYFGGALPCPHEMSVRIDRN